jgi:hypothetical protein
MLMELAVIECRLAALALSGGEVGEAVRSLSRASYFLRLRAREDEPPARAAIPPPPRR